VVTTTCTSGRGSRQRGRIDDEVADDSPHAQVARMEEHISAGAGLLYELGTKLDDLEADGRL
jgi:hypothetical protein